MLQDVMEGENVKSLSRGKTVRKYSLCDIQASLTSSHRELRVRLYPYDFCTPLGSQSQETTISATDVAQGAVAQG
jgi:hypothetical protein